VAPDVVLEADANTDAFMVAMYVWFDPPAGSQTLAWSWAGTPDFGVAFGWDSYDDVVSATPRDTAAVQDTTPPFSTGVLTVVSGDLVLVAAGAFDDTAETSAWTWVNATERAELNDADSATLSLADAAPSGDVTITAEETTEGSDGGILAVVLAPGGGGATDVTGTESLPAVLAEQAAVRASVAVAESLADVVDEQADLRASSAGAETVAVVAVEAASQTVVLQADDTLAAALAEAEVIHALVAPADAAQARADEASTLFAEIGLSDTAGVVATDAESVSTLVAADEQAAIAVSHAASALVTATANESLRTDVASAVALVVAAPVAESLRAVTSDAASPFAQVSSTESIRTRISAEAQGDVTFAASDDHETVTSYEMRVRVSGESEIIATENIGKPPEGTDGNITVNMTTLFGTLSPGNYTIAAAAISPGGTTEGAESAAFSLPLDDPGASDIDEVTFVSAVVSVPETVSLIAGTESPLVTIFLMSSDVVRIVSAEEDALLVLAAISDILGVTTAEALVLLGSLATQDTAVMVATETGSIVIDDGGMVLVVATDSLPMVLMEAAALDAVLVASESLGVRADDAVAIRTAIAVVDALLTGVSNTAVAAVLIAAQETVAAQTSESGTLAVVVTAQDAEAFGASEAAALLADLVLTEIVVLVPTDAVGLVATFAAADAPRLQVGEIAIPLVSLVTLDAVGARMDDAAAVINRLVASDSILVVASAVADRAERASPSTVVDDATIGTLAWADPDNAKISDGLYATCTSAGGESHYLKATEFGFAIPSGSTILGIQVDIQRGGFSAGGFLTDAAVKIVRAGQIGVEDKALVSTWGAQAYVSYGGSSDLWDETWTAEDINADNFGVVLAVNASLGFPAIADVDHIRITVSYDEVAAEPSIDPAGSVGAASWSTGRSGFSPRTFTIRRRFP
jgi:hypothetical protein